MSLKVDKFMMFLAVLYLPLLSTGQVNTDSAASDDSEWTGFKKLRPVFSFDTRRSFIIGKYSVMYGAKVGGRFGKYRFGLGYYKLDVPIKLDNIDDHYEIHQTLDYNYTNIYLERILHRDKKWELSSPLAIGIGLASVDTISLKFDSPGVKEKANMIVITVGADAHYKILYWIGIGTGIGYRQIISNDRAVRNAYNAPDFNAKIKLFIGDLYLHHREERRKKAGM